MSANSPSSPSYSGPANQPSPPAPLQPPTKPCANSLGKIGFAYQMYQGNGTNGVGIAVLPDHGITLHNVQMYNPATGLGSQSLTAYPFHHADEAGFNFIGKMQKGCWDLGYIAHDDGLLLSDLQGSSTAFNTNVDLGLLILHGTYGVSPDYVTGRPANGIYFAIAAGASGQYLSMSDMVLGGPSPTNGLKWMAILACESLYQANWNSMKSQGIKPYNSNMHMILGCATEANAEPLIGQCCTEYLLENTRRDRGAMPIGPET